MNPFDIVCLCVAFTVLATGYFLLWLYPEPKLEADNDVDAPADDVDPPTPYRNVLAPYQAEGIVSHHFWNRRYEYDYNDDLHRCRFDCDLLFDHVLYAIEVTFHGRRHTSGGTPFAFVNPCIYVEVLNVDELSWVALPFAFVNPCSYVEALGVGPDCKWDDFVGAKRNELHVSIAEALAILRAEPLVLAAHRPELFAGAWTRTA